MSELEPIQVTVPPPNAPKTIDIDLGEDRSKEPVVTKEQPQKDFENEGIELLRRQLEEKKREADEARREKAEAIRRAAEKEREVNTYKVEARDSQLTSFVNAIASYERDAEMLERDYANTLAEGDYGKAAKLQRQMAQVESKLMQLNQGKASVEERLEMERYRAANPEPLPPVHQVPSDPLEAQIQGLSPAAQSWVRSNQYVLTDQTARNAMTAGHFNALARNIRVDSPEYFQFIENEIANAGVPPSNAPPQARSYNPAVTAAPVSRSSSTITRTPRGISITLTPAQREAARDNGMSDEEYAEAMLYYQNKDSTSGN